MFNPFLKRASEHLRDDEAFLATVSPVPVLAHIVPRATALYDRLVLFTGTPGSGKTTFAKLLRFPTLTTLNRLHRLPEHRPLLDAMAQINATSDGQVHVVGCRLPMDPRYREIWELPYKETTRNALLARLIQARAVQEWLAGFEGAGMDLAAVSVVPRASGSATLAAIGGDNVALLANRAKAAETSTYTITRALVPPDEADLSDGSLQGYDPFHAIDVFRYSPRDEKSRDIKPLVIIDDAHDLHPKQFEFIEQWLRQREVGPARWIMTRLDILGSNEVIGDEDDAEAPPPGFETSREVTSIRLQGQRRRPVERSDFRQMANDIARRGLSQLETFSRKGLNNLAPLLETSLPELSDKVLTELEAGIERQRVDNNISVARVAAIKNSVEEFSASRADMTRGVKLQSASILLHRYANRTQTSLFEDEDPAPSRELNIGADLFDGARLQLMHKFDAPFYYGFADVADGSWENAQQFLTFAAAIVDAIETKLIRDRGHTLNAAEQDKILRSVGRTLIEEWNFPYSAEVRRLTDWIAQEATARSLQPTAPLSAGANAVAIPQEEFESLLASGDRLLAVLKFAVAYNALSILTKRSIKGRLWAIMELGGPLVLMHRLPLRRGGFVSKTLKDLQTALRGPE